MFAKSKTQDRTPGQSDQRKTDLARGKLDEELYKSFEDKGDEASPERRLCLHEASSLQYGSPKKPQKSS